MSEKRVDKKDSLDFETALKRLEAIVDRLESGDAKLEESIKIYEEGMGLKAQCEEKLKEASVRVEKITLSEDGKPRAEKWQGG